MPVRGETAPRTRQVSSAQPVRRAADAAAAPVVAAARKRAGPAPGWEAKAPAPHHTKENARTPHTLTHAHPNAEHNKMSIIIDDAGVNGADGKNVYVGNLSWETDDAQLLELVSQYGTVTSAHVETSKSGRSLGYGLVAYASEADDVGAALCYNVRYFHTHFSRTHTSQHKSVRRVQHINHH